MNDEKALAWFRDMRLDAYTNLGGWINETTGRGDPERDKNANTAWVPSVILPVQTTASLFAKNPLARAVCTAHPEWGFRNGWDLNVDLEPIKARRIEKGVRRYFERLRAQAALVLGGTWGLALGGGLILVGVEDGAKVSAPLVRTKIRSITYLRVVPRSQVEIAGFFNQPDRDRFGEPSLYRVKENPGGTGPQVTSEWHASRVIAFPGLPLDEDLRVQNAGWDESILDLVVRDLMKHDTLWDDTGGMFADGSQGVWKIQGLMKAVSAGLEDAIRARFKLAEQARSIFRSLLLDADKEDFQYVHRQFSGIDALLAQSVIRVAGAAQIPATVLMGQSPAGMNATGESDLELWYGRVRAWQQNVAHARLHRLVELVLAAHDGPLGEERAAPPDWSVELRDPRSLTPMQQAELRARQAQIDTAEVTAGITRPEEVAINRYGADGWSASTTIDLEWRRARLKDPAALAEWIARGPQAVETGAGGDPNAPPAPGLGEGKQAPQNPKSGAAE